MATEEAFAKLLGRHPSEKERERLYRVRDALGIQENDAFWYIVMTLEHYDSLYDGYPAKMAQAAEDAIARARGAFEAAAVAESVAVRRLLAEEVRRVAAKSGEELSGFVGVVGAVLAAVVVFGAICVSAGFALGSGRGLWAAGPASGVGWRLVAWVLSAPAGWMAFALLLPGLVHVGRRGCVSSEALTKNVHPQGRRSRATARDRDGGGQDRPTRDRRGDERHLRRGLPRVLVRVREGLQRPARDRRRGCEGVLEEGEGDGGGGAFRRVITRCHTQAGWLPR